MAKLFPCPSLSLAILLLWVVLDNGVSAAALLLGGVLGVVIPIVSAPFWPDPPRLARPWRVLPMLRMVRFLGFFALDIVTSSWRVARQVIGPLCRLQPGLVSVALDLRDPFVATLLASVVSLTPGTVAVDLDRRRWILLVHCLDARDPEAVARAIKQRYELPLREIFGC